MDEKPVFGFSIRWVFSLIGFCSPCTIFPWNLSAVLFVCSLLLSITFISVLNASSNPWCSVFEQLVVFSMGFCVRHFESIGGRVKTRLLSSNNLLPGDDKLFILFFPCLAFFFLRFPALIKTLSSVEVFPPSPRTSSSMSVLWHFFSSVSFTFNCGRKNGRRLVLVSLMFRTLRLLKIVMSWNKTLYSLIFAIIDPTPYTLRWKEIKLTRPSIDEAVDNQIL